MIVALACQPSLRAGSSDLEFVVSYTDRNASTGSSRAALTSGSAVLRELLWLHQARRPLFASHSRRRRALRLATGYGEAWEISLAHPAHGAAPLQGSRGSTCQQDGAHGLGLVNLWGHISGASAFGCSIGCWPMEGCV